MRGDLLDLACLQPIHVDVDAICYKAISVSLQEEQLHWKGRLPSLRLPELPNSAMVAVGVQEGGQNSYEWRLERGSFAIGLRGDVCGKL